MEPMKPLKRPEGASLTIGDAALLGGGMLCVSAAAMFYRAKRTTPFKLAYFFSWPLLGGACIRVFGPNRDEMENELRQRGVDSQQLQTSKQQMQQQMAALKQAAEEGKTNDQWPDNLQKPKL